MDFINDIEANYGRPLMGKVPSRYLDVLTETENLYVLDYRYGMSIGVRRLLEDFIIENYGAMIHKSGKLFGQQFPSQQLRQLRNINAKYILAVFSPYASNIDSLASTENFKGYKNKIDGVLLTGGVLKRALLENIVFDELFRLYDFISDYLHGNGGEPSQKGLMDGLTLVMKSCSDYVQKGLGWGVQ